MTPLVITSFNEAGFAKYGKRFLESVIRHWPLEEIELVVYTEGEPVVITGYPVRYMRLETSPLLHEFLTKYQAVPRYAGRDSSMGVWKTKERIAGYNFRYDALKFSKKIFAIQDAALQFPGRRIYWLDADVVARAPLPATFFKTVMPAPAVLCYLGRKGTHSECGFVGYDLRDPRVAAMVQEFGTLYTSGKVFEMAEWHDSFVFDRLREKYKVAEHNLSNADTGHVWMTSPLVQYLDHLKGDRKDLGYSPELLTR